MTLDPVDHAVISQGIIAAAREMGSKLVRSAYSTVVREAADASAALMDRQGRVVAQAEMIPMQLGSMRATWTACAQRHPVETLVEGDFYLSNDPYNGGQHIPDVFIFQPVFFEGRVIGFAASVAHHLEMGGAAAGIVADATDLYQEGLRLPPARWNLERDWDGGPLQAPDRGQHPRAPAHPGRLQRPVRRQRCGRRTAEGTGRQVRRRETLEASMAELIAYSERRVRAAIAELSPTAPGTAKTSSTTTASTMNRLPSGLPSRSWATPFTSTLPAPAARSRAISTARFPRPTRRPSHRSRPR